MGIYEAGKLYFMHIQSHYRIHTWSFVGKIFLYLIATTFLFVATTEGWATLATIGKGIVFVPVILAIVSLIAGYQWFVEKKKELYVNTYLGLVVLVSQCVLLLLNRGDCGDGFGGTSINFIQRIQGIESCSRNSIPLVDELLPYAAFYGIAFIIFLFIALFDYPRKK